LSKIRLLPEHHSFRSVWLLWQIKRIFNLLAVDHFQILLFMVLTMHDQNIFWQT